ncbi:hypothetical protein TEA_023525 [Camellia sinensis var. sinensis]|uniref:anthranilate synthase n=1 Tax=Camellia sinensis var. sinensis TaxID=542762 RepID=A0A4S4D0J1_CAMSN|nr:hypothetical protein TEA_023525 [Camellia sinensis var. sinensis]
METMRATGLVCQSSLVEFKRSSLPRKTLTPHPPTGSRVSLPFRNHGSLLLLRMAEHSKIPMAVSQNASVASQLVSVKNKITNPIVVIDNYDSFTYNLCQNISHIPSNASLSLLTSCTFPRFYTLSVFTGCSILLTLDKCGCSKIAVLGTILKHCSLNFDVYFVEYMGELGCNFEVYRNDELTVDELKKKNPRGVLISPGPGTPQDSGISLKTVLELGPTVPLFGVCMGLQCIGEAFGGKIVRSPHGVMHGKSSLVYHNEGGEDGLFSGLSNPFTAGRYHSLVIEKESFPHEALEMTAWTEDGLVMAARHKIYRHLLGVQFHPESIITSEGKMIVKNFIKLIEKKEEAESQE